MKTLISLLLVLALALPAFASGISIGGGTSSSTEPVAWANWTVAATVVTLQANFNVTSVVRNAQGDFTVNFTSALTANYACTFGARGTAASNTIIIAEQHDTVTRTTTALRLYTMNPTTAAATDPTLASIACFR